MLELKLVNESGVSDQRGNLSAGQQLKKARLALGWDVAQISGRLKIPESYIHFLEKDEYTRLPNDTFARGYLLAYAKYMDMPIETVSKAYNQQTTPVPEKKARRFFLGKREVKASDPVVLWTSFIIAIACLALSVLWWQDQFEMDDISAVVSDQVSIKTADGKEIIENLSALPAKKSDISVQPDSGHPASDRQGDADKISTSSPLDTHDSTRPESELSAPGRQSITDFHTQGVSIQENILEVLFSDASWVEIKDARGQKLATGVKKMGEHLLLKNISFFDIVIGNAAAVKLSYNSAPVDLGTYVDASNVAKLTLGY